jgi:hypothetical protein
MNFTTASSHKACLKLNNSFLGLLVVFLLASCTKPQDGFIQTKSGNNLLNSRQTDTISIDMVSEIVPRLPNTANLTADILGTFNDPLFGRTTASVYTQVRVGNNPSAPSWSKTSTLDSLVLTLKLSNITVQLGQNGIIGTSNFKGQTWHLFKLATSMPSGIDIPSDTTLPAPMEIGKAVVSFNQADSILRMTIKGSNVNSVFRDSLFDSTGNSTLFTDQTEFDALMHGLYISPDSALGSSAGDGTLAAFNLRDTNSRVTIYYDTKFKWYMTMYTPSLPVQRVNIYNHNYTNSIAKKYAALPGKAVDRVFVQSLGGVRCIVKIPYLSRLLKDSMIAINQAEFIFPKVDSSSDPYNNNFPPKMLLRPRKTNGEDSLNNFRDDVFDYYQQNYQNDAKAYKFLMTAYMQRLLFNYRNKPYLPTMGLNLYIPPDGPNTPSRVLLYTQHSGNKKNLPKLVITYTKVADKK